MRYLLDTCFISELVRRSPNAGALRWLEGQDETRLFLSVVTIGEIQKGIAKLDDADKRNALSAWVRDNIRTRFENRILPVDETVARRWGELQGTVERRGNKIPVLDGLLAATALAHELIVVTRNEKDFLRCGVEIFNPWDSWDK